MTRRTFLAAAASVVRPVPDRWMALDILRCTEFNNFPDPAASVCFGSLLKPFLVCAFAQTHSTFPTVDCTGMPSGCWYSLGHGKQDIVAALANSCNAYFLRLAAAIDRAALDTVSLHYGLAVPSRALAPSQLIGLNAGWPQAPRDVVNAFARLTGESTEGARIAMAGMRRCAQAGTARAAGFACYAKTGTAPCTHLPRAPGDGFALAIYPLDQPRRVLLVESHGTTGAMAARKLTPIAAGNV
jgi:cell division protein FtsI/penicillin-binding protein 2